MTGFTFATTPRLVCRPGAAAELGAVLDGRFGARVLVVTDAGVRRAGLADAALASLRAAGVDAAVFDAVRPDPPDADILAGAEAARAHGATGVVGLGGGSPLDVAKLVALLAGSGERLGDIYGVGLAKGPRLPLALLPTTAGTGSEATPIAIVTTGAGADGATEKKGVVSPVLLPDLAVLDAALTLGLPPATTAATGVDAMVHAIEAHASASPNNNAVSRALAREALRLLGANIEAATLRAPDLPVREAMLLGSFLAGQAFANSPVAAVHALAYPLGARHHLPHGLSNALVLPHVLRFNAAGGGEGAARAVASYAEIAADAFPALAHVEPADARAARFADELAALALRLRLPPRLRDAGVPEADLPAMAVDAMKQTRLLVNNPRPVTEADALAIYGAAW